MAHHFSLRSFVIVCAVLGSGLTSLLQAAPPADGPKVFVGYVYGNIKGIDYKLYTHLCHAFVTAGKDGKLNSDRGVPSKELTGAAHRAGVKVLLSLGGWGWDEQFAGIVADSAAEDRYVEAVLALVADNDYDGIDLDWEYPNTKDDVVGFERLSRRLRKGIDDIGAKRNPPQPMFLTMAASADPPTLKALDPKFLLDTLDWINVMTYDFAGEWSNEAGHNAPLFASSKVKGGGPSIERTIKFLLDDQKIPPQRIALGLPLYGRGFVAPEPYAPKEKGKARGGNYTNIAKLLADEKWTRMWDDETKTPWLKSPDGKQVIGYDDAESLTIKTKWAMERGLRGVFFWEVRGDKMDDGSHPLQEAAHAALMPAAPN
jgi:chitinase